MNNEKWNGKEICTSPLKGGGRGRNDRAMLGRGREASVWWDIGRNADRGRNGWYRSGRWVGNGVSPYIHPPLQVVTSRHCSRLEREAIEFRCSDVSCRSGVPPIKFCYQVWCMDIVPWFPGIVFDP